MVDSIEGSSAEPTASEATQTTPSGQGRSGVQREAPKVNTGRRELVEWWNKQVNTAKQSYSDRFTKMAELQRFARGHQWPRGQEANYVVNVTLRQLSQRTAQLYAKNPTAVAHMRKRLDNTVWDGTQESLAQAQQTLQMATMAGPALQEATDPTVIMAVQQQIQRAQAVLADYERVRQERTMRRRMGQTLELLYDYNVDEQDLPFKTMMKLTVLRALTVGIGWVKLGFQRATELTPDLEGRIQDMTEALRDIEAASADMADGKTRPDSKEAEALRLQLQALQEQSELLIREGLVFDFPGGRSVIPSEDCRHLKTLFGASWVAQEYFLTPQQVQRIYNIDVTSQYNGHSGTTADSFGGAFPGAPANAGLGGNANQDDAARSQGMALVRQVYCKSELMTYTICDGYPDFLREPGPPDVWMERFYPWFALVFNDVDDDTDAQASVMPPSDTELIYHPQMEINRARESLREHRIANRPAYANATGTLSETDREKLEQRPAHAVLEISALQPGQSVDDVLQPIKPVPVDPALYNVNPQYEDILRSGGMQEANLGGTGGATATESSIAAASQGQHTSSNVDDLDEVLTALARSGGQVLLDNVDKTTVERIVGPGAVWPEMSRSQIARDLWLEIEAGSTGRPNQAQEIANLERLTPLLLQLPGLNPRTLAKEAVRRLDDRLDVDEALMDGQPSIMAMNTAVGANPGSDPTGQAPQQGPEGVAPVENPAMPAGTPGGVDTTQPAPDMAAGVTAG